MVKQFLSLFYSDIYFPIFLALDIQTLHI